MQKIIEHLYVGTANEVPFVKDFGWSILGVCKEPLHRQNARLKGAEQDGYLGRAMSKEEPEYLWAERKHALYCNLIDAPNPKYIPNEIIDKSLRFIDEELAIGQNVLVVCNKAKSRSPSIVFMWMIDQGMFDAAECWMDAFTQFKNIYSYYQPSTGFYEYTKNFWSKRQQKRTNA